MPDDAPENGLYKAAGVDIDAGNALISAIAPLAAATKRSGVAGGLGGFGAVFDPKAAGYRDPLLVACTDGVGTKLKLALETGLLDGIGIDLVAMNVNDLVVQGAEPLFFLDYYATGRLDPELAARVIGGIAKGCEQAGCALIGGETAELPGLYQGRDFDLAGFALGAVERGGLCDGSAIQAGDAVIGIASSGAHSNGYSLLRKVVAESGAALDAPAPFAPQSSLAACLMAPTRIYVRALLPLLRNGWIRGLAHITGGGLVENIPRSLPDGLSVTLDAGSWAIPPLFRWLAETGGIPPAEMARVFNLGIGMVAMVPDGEAEAVIAALAASGETAYRIGAVSASDSHSAEIKGLADALHAA